jgi:ribonuclease HI
MDIIDKLKPKACGPDGIPLQIIQRLTHIYAPIFCKIIDALTDISADLPPSANDFNTGLLIMIPKKCGGLSINDLRPITICNYSNRIVSSFFKQLLMPEFSRIIGQEQAAFLCGRSMVNTILESLHDFYNGSVTNDHVLHLLIDFRKCYDRIDREMLFKILEKWRLPLPIITALRRLHTNVTAKVWCDISTSIHIQRGIKQGDPLSVLMVLPFMQLLIDATKKHCDFVQAYADDALFGFKLTHINNNLSIVLNIIDAFCSSGTGFEVNIKKSYFLSSRNLCPTELQPTWTRTQGKHWQNIQFNVRTTDRLGVMYGPRINNQLLWGARIERIEASSHSLASSNVASKNGHFLISNTYIASQYRWTSQFYEPPKHVQKRYSLAVSTLVLPKFKCISHDLLFLPPECGGPRPQLHHPIAFGHASRICNILPTWIRLFGHTANPWMPEFDSESRLHQYDPILHFARSCSRFPDIFERERRQIIYFDKLGAKYKPDQRNIYLCILDRLQISRRAIAALRKKIANWRHVDSSSIDLFLKHFLDSQKALYKIPFSSQGAYHTSLMVFNALPCKRRNAWFHRKQQRAVDDLIRCPVCNAQESVDDITHLWTTCEPIQQGIRAIIRFSLPNLVDVIKLPIHLNEFLFFSSVNSLSPAWISEINLIIWRTHNEAVHPYNRLSNKSDLDVPGFMLSTFSERSAYGKSACGDPPAILRSDDISVMSRRAHANRSLSDELLLSPDLSDCIIAFSDGSHFRQGTNVYNTGFSVIFPQYKFVSVCGTIVPSASNTSFQVDFPLSNIRAELFAILVCIEKAKAIDPSGSSPLIIVTDCAYVLQVYKLLPHYIKQSWTTSSGASVRNIDLLSSMHRYCFVNDCRLYRPIIFRHVYSHTLDTSWCSEWNSVADLAARYAANDNALSAPPRPYLHRATFSNDRYYGIFPNR